MPPHCCLEPVLNRLLRLLIYAVADTVAALPRSHQPTSRPFYGHASTVESGFLEGYFDDEDDLDYEDEDEYIEVLDEDDFEFGESPAETKRNATCACSCSCRRSAGTSDSALGVRRPGHMATGRARR